MSRPKRRKAGEWTPAVPWLGHCFGYGRDEGIDDPCDCPARLHALCDETRFNEARSPRIERMASKGRGYTPVPNLLLRDWGLGEGFSGVQLTYLGLVSWTTPRNRVVLNYACDLAEERHLSLKAYYAHITKLERLQLVERKPRQQFVESRFYAGQHDAFELLDLPGWIDDDDAKAELLRKVVPALVRRRKPTPPPSAKPERGYTILDRDKAWNELKAKKERARQGRPVTNRDDEDDSE